MFSRGPLSWSYILWKNYVTCPNRLGIIIKKNPPAVYWELVLDFFFVCFNVFLSKFPSLFAVQYVQKLFKRGSRAQICLLDENNYVYSCKHKAQGRYGAFANWRCINMTSNKCPARCSTLNDRLKSVKGEHNHAPTFCQQTMILIDDSSLLFQKNETWQDH